MSIKKLIEVQRIFDEAHDWLVDKNNSKELLDSAQKNALGVVAELGEFINILKKIEREKPNEYAYFIEQEKEHLDEELIDTLIYLLRLFNELDVDVEATFLKKQKANDARFKNFLH